MLASSPDLSSLMYNVSTTHLNNKKLFKKQNLNPMQSSPGQGEHSGRNPCFKNKNKKEESEQLAFLSPFLFSAQNQKLVHYQIFHLRKV